MDETPIEIVDYDPAWPERFEAEADRVWDALGDRVLWVVHIGSTAVPGLPSKPIVDLCPVVEDRGTALECVEPLETIGYRFGYDFEDDRIHLGRAAADGQQFNLHLRWEATVDGLEENLLLREYLRDHSEARSRYEELKRAAANAHPNDVERYSDAKTPFIEEVLTRARAEGYNELIGRLVDEQV